MHVTLIDGPSGSGKTTLAAELAAVSGDQLVHLDDFYPGWQGLAAGAEIVARDVLDPVRPGYWRWDWGHNRPSTWVSLIPGCSLIVEGVGAISAASVARARSLGPTRLLLVDGPVALRRARVLVRDPDCDTWWDMWAQQEDSHFQQLAKLQKAGLSVIQLVMPGI